MGQVSQSILTVLSDRKSRMWKKTEISDYPWVDYFKGNTQLVSKMYGVD